MIGIPPGGGLVIRNDGKSVEFRAIDVDSEDILVESNDIYRTHDGWLYIYDRPYDEKWPDTIEQL